MADDDEEALRRAMVATQLVPRGLTDPRLLDAFRAVPRHLFVPVEARAQAYEDHPIAIGHGQTISQPYIVALMTSLLALEPGDTVLEIGAGSGYQTAILAALGCRVVALELLAPLADRARATLAALGVDRVSVQARDGRDGAPELAPPGGWHGIVCAAAARVVPPALLAQLAIGARLVIPIGPELGPQTLDVYQRTADGIVREEVLAVRFVPLV